MRKDVIKIYEETPESKQVIMLSATFPDFIKKDVKNFMRNQSQIFVDPGELTLEGLKQYYLTITEVNFNIFRIENPQDQFTCWIH